jgi:hypothetical protein
LATLILKQGFNGRRQLKKSIDEMEQRDRGAEQVSPFQCGAMLIQQIEIATKKLQARRLIEEELSLANNYSTAFLMNIQKLRTAWSWHCSGKHVIQMNPFLEMQELMSEK